MNSEILSQIDTIKYIKEDFPALWMSGCNIKVKTILELMNK